MKTQKYFIHRKNSYSVALYKKQIMRGLIYHYASYLQLLNINSFYGQVHISTYLSEFWQYLLMKFTRGAKKISLINYAKDILLRITLAYLQII